MNDTEWADEGYDPSTEVYDHSAEAQTIDQGETLEEIEAAAERAYRAMYGGAPETIRSGDEVVAEGRGRWQGGSLVWDAVDWTM